MRVRFAVSYAQRALDHKRKNLNCGDGWGLVGKLHGVLNFEGVVLGPWKNEESVFKFPLSF